MSLNQRVVFQLLLLLLLLSWLAIDGVNVGCAAYGPHLRATEKLHIFSLEQWQIFAQA